MRIGVPVSPVQLTGAPDVAVLDVVALGAAQAASNGTMQKAIMNFVIAQP
jgi:hypothetical protein